MRTTPTRVLMSTDTVGGVWTYALELARGLAAHGVEVHLAALGRRPDPAQRNAAEAVPGLHLYSHDCRLEWMQEPWAELAAAGDWLLELEARVAPDVVHLNHYCHGDLDWQAPVLMVGHSCVYSWHQWVQGRQPDTSWQRYHIAVTAGLRAANLVVAPTGAMLADLERFYGPFRAASVIANGRRPQDFPPAAKRPRIVSAGRLWDEAKNSAALAAVAPHLEWPVEIIGDCRHPDGGRIDLPNVELPGPLPPAALARRLGAAAIYALPARYEPFGLSALEAALAGCALVLGDIPSLREVWGDSALFVAPDDHDELTAALQQLIAQPQLRHRLARRARERARHFSAERMTRAYLAAYDSLESGSDIQLPPLRRHAGATALAEYFA